MQAPGLAVDGATLCDDSEPWHVAGVELGQFLDVGVHHDHHLVMIGLFGEVGEHVSAEAGGVAVATTSGEVVTEYPCPGRIGVDELGSVGGEVANEPAAVPAVGIDEQLHSSDE